MQSHSDQDLVILVTLGGWIRGTQVVTSTIVQSYDERSAKVLRQPALVHFMQSKVNEISPELRNEPLVKDVSGELSKIEKLVSFPPGKTPDIEGVRKINEAVGKMMGEIENKETTTQKKLRPVLRHRAAVSTLFRSICSKARRAAFVSFIRTSEPMTRVRTRCVATK